MAQSQPTFGLPGTVNFTGSKPNCQSHIRSAIRGDATKYKEDLLQRLIQDDPHLLPINDFLPSAKSVFSLGVEIPLDVGDKSGYIDNLLITNDGRFVIVETKLWRNPESTREVIAQVLQYGMSLSSLSLRELEAKLPELKGRALEEYVASKDSNQTLVDGFEDLVERNLRRGDMLYLIVSDGLRVGVERITHWLNEGGSAPFKFGLVEFQFFDVNADSLLVVPRAILKTKEISRHVVVVDVKGPGSSLAVATVQDDRKTVAAGLPAQRTIKATVQPMTAPRLIEEVTAKYGSQSAETLSRLLDAMDRLGVQARPTATNIQYGLTIDESSFYPLISFNTAGAWSQPFSTLIDLIGDEQFVAHKVRMNGTSVNFYKPAEVEDPTKRKNGLEPKYADLTGKEAAIAQAIAETKDSVLALMG